MRANPQKGVLMLVFKNSEELRSFIVTETSGITSEVLGFLGDDSSIDIFEESWASGFKTVGQLSYNEKEDYYLLEVLDGEPTVFTVDGFSVVELIR